jgi:hypothetical protein
MAVMNKRLLISESRGDSNRCTPCRGKPDQHDMYASHISPRTSNVCFLQVVPVRGNLSRVIDRVEQGHCSQEKRLPTQSTTRRLTDPWVCTQFLSQANLKEVGQSQASTDGRLLGLLDLYHQYVIGTFNTCSRVQTPQSLTDTSGGYHIKTLESPHHSPHHSLPSVPLIPLNGPARSPFFQNVPNDLKRNQTLNLVSGSLHSTSTVIYYLSISWANHIWPRDRFNKGDPEGSS